MTVTADKSFKRDKAYSHALSDEERRALLAEAAKSLLDTNTGREQRAFNLQRIHRALSSDPELAFDAIASLREHQWKDRFSQQPSDQRRASLESAVRLAADPGANPHEKRLHIRMIEAMMEVDFGAALDAFASVQTNKAVKDTMQQLRDETAEAKTEFGRLATAVQTLRQCAIQLGLIRPGERLPETLGQWKARFDNLLVLRNEWALAKEAHVQDEKLQFEMKLREFTALLQQLRANILNEEANLRRDVPFYAKVLGDSYSSLVAFVNKTATSVSKLHIEVDPFVPGQRVPNEGIYTRLWAPHTERGSLQYIYQLYAAPEDLRYAPNVGGPKTYTETAEKIENLRKWHGHDGMEFSTEESLIGFFDRCVKSLMSTRNLRFNTWLSIPPISRWFIPPREILDGQFKNSNGTLVKVSRENLFDLRHKFAPKDSMKGKYYWSSTPGKLPEYMVDINFETGRDDQCHIENFELDCRPVRISAVKLLSATP